MNPGNPASFRPGEQRLGRTVVQELSSGNFAVSAPGARVVFCRARDEVWALLERTEEPREGVEWRSKSYEYMVKEGAMVHITSKVNMEKRKARAEALREAAKLAFCGEVESCICDGCSIGRSILRQIEEGE